MELEEQIQRQQMKRDNGLMDQERQGMIKNREQLIYERSLLKFEQFLSGLDCDLKERELKTDLVEYPFNFIKVRQEYLLDSNYEIIHQIYRENVNKYLQKHYQVIESCKKWKTWQTKFMIWLVVKYCKCYKKDV